MKLWINRWLAIGSLGALLLTVGSLTPAQADRTSDRLEHAVRHDIDVVHRDQTHLNDLYRKRDDQRDRSDWRGERRTERDIDRANLDLQRDQAYLSMDQRALDRYYNRDRDDRDHYDHDR